MRPSKYFDITWYSTSDQAKHRIVVDQLEDFETKINTILQSPDIISFFVMTHNTMPKEG